MENSFGEMNEKQRDKIKKYLIENFAKRFFEIPESLAFFEGKTNEMSFGRIGFKRVEENLVHVDTYFKSQYPNGGITVREAHDEIDLSNL